MRVTDPAGRGKKHGSGMAKDVSVVREVARRAEADLGIIGTVLSSAAVEQKVLGQAGVPAAAPGQHARILLPLAMGWARSRALIRVLGGGSGRAVPVTHAARCFAGEAVSCTGFLAVPGGWC
jgi:hypothetical protein